MVSKAALRSTHSEKRDFQLSVDDERMLPCSGPV